MTVARTGIKHQQMIDKNGGLSEDAHVSDPSLDTSQSKSFWVLVSLCAAEKYSIRYIYLLL